MEHTYWPLAWHEETLKFMVFVSQLIRLQTFSDEEQRNEIKLFHYTDSHDRERKNNQERKNHIVNGRLSPNVSLLIHSIHVENIASGRYP